jgi:hypothetical protein
MRCYFMRADRIEGVELLKPASDDDLIRQARALFEARAGQKFDGFEVWDLNRFVYRYQAERSDP